MSTVYEFEINKNGDFERYEFNHVAKQANGSVLVTRGNAVILATVVTEFNNPSFEMDFTPLTVQYIEKAYAAGKLPGGFFKRESKPNDFEVLTSRIIDRSLRPLFNDSFIYPTTITITVLSADEKVDLQTLSLNAASAALYVSDLPVTKSVSAVRIAKINSDYIINPTMNELNKSTLDLYVSGSQTELLMIEMKTISSQHTSQEDDNQIEHCVNEMNCDDLVEVIGLAQDTLHQMNHDFEETFRPCQKEIYSIETNISKIDSSLVGHIQSHYNELLDDAIGKMAKSEREGQLTYITNTIAQDQWIINKNYNAQQLNKAVEMIKKQKVRSMIINQKIRPDGRALTAIRPIDIQTNILPSAHSSCLFTRGNTQALVVATLSDSKNGQMYDNLTTKHSLMENFMVHYNFPGFSVGEAKPTFGVTRRELGHGYLAKKALEPVLHKPLNQTVRLVSEILESNGSSSMATVCGASLALKAAGIPMAGLVAGLSMGMVIENDEYALLTDIVGLEDCDGDMDFKVAGTSQGFTALQMDIKLKGVDLTLLKKALDMAHEAKNSILDLMEKASLSIVSSPALPCVEYFRINTNKSMVVIGKAGSTIRTIIERFDVDIDLNKQTGQIKVTGTSSKNVSDACDYIRQVIKKSDEESQQQDDKGVNFELLYHSEEVLQGTIDRIVDFGAFVTLPKGGEGLLHISKISSQKINKVQDVLSIGQELDVKVLTVKKDRIELACL